MSKTETLCPKSYALKKPKYYTSNYDVIDSGATEDGKRFFNLSTLIRFFISYWIRSRGNILCQPPKQFLPSLSISSKVATCKIQATIN